MQSRRQRPACASDLTFDRLVGGELSLEEERALRGHVAACDACRARLDEIRAEQRAFADVAPRSALSTGPIDERVTLDRQRAAKSRRAVWLGAVPFLAAAACLVLLSRRSPIPSMVNSSIERTKGKALSYYVMRKGEITAGSDLHSLHPGDRVEFTFSADKPGYLAIFSVDGAGEASLYFPPSATHAAPFAAGAARPVPLSTVLDGTLGKERIYAFYCDSAIELAPVLSTLSAGTDSPLSVEGCVTHTLEFRKEQP